MVPILDRLKTIIRHQGGSVENTRTIESAISELERLDKIALTKAAKISRKSASKERKVDESVTDETE